MRMTIAAGPWHQTSSSWDVLQCLS